MKRAITVSNILSWVNLVIGGFLALCSLFFIIALPPLAVLISFVLVGCIVLHSYASLQLRKSILNSAIPLSRQTPVGIRMMGYVSLFFAFMLFTNAIYMLQHTKDLLKQVKIPSQIKESDFISAIHLTAIFILLFTASIIMNVLLNFRLLKWYTIFTQNNNNPQ